MPRVETYGALRGLTRDRLEAVWLDTRIPCSEIAALFGVHLSAIEFHAKKLGLPNRPVRGLDATKRARDIEFQRMWDAGVKITLMAKHFGMSRGYVCQKRIRMKLAPREPRKGAGGFGGFGGITVAQFRELQLGEAMRRVPHGS